MVQRLGGLPYWELRFDAQGDTDPAFSDRLLDEVPRSGVTDLVVFSHGWNNDPDTARSLYRRFFGLVEPILQQHGSRGTVGIAGVIWPSMAWLDEPIPDFPLVQGGAASFAAVPPSDAELVTALEAVFTLPEQQVGLQRLARLLEERPDDPARLEEFHALLRELVDADPVKEVAEEDSGEASMLTDEPVEVYRRFLATSEVLAASAGAGDDEPAMRLVDTALPLADEPASAGLADWGDRLWDGAKVALRQATYFSMKRRAGAVGKRGLGPLLGRLSAAWPSPRVHLIGHSFGARLVSFALAGMPDGIDPSPVKSLLLLQGAFSHFAFAPVLPHDVSRGGALAGRASRVDGPIVCCFSVHDSALGVLYPAASFSSRQDAAARTELAYRWSAVGYDGAQSVGAEEVVIGPVGERYPFTAGRFLNIDARDVVRNGRPLSGAHSDIFHPELAWVAVAAAGLAPA